jgi:glycosyltransferase involved in cell wall biosynthesis
VESTYIPYGGQLVDALPSDRVVELGLRPGAYVLVVARLLPENNIDLVLDAVSDLGPGVELVVVGTAGYASPLEGRLAAEHDRGTLRWLRHVADQTLLTQLWRHCGIYVHGHSVGGTNPALLQALGAGAPTLALDTPFNREVVEHLDQLFPHDRAELARRIGALLGDPERRRELAARGRRIVASRYSWDTVCDRYTGLLVELATVAQSARSGMAWRRMRKARSSIAAPAAHSAIDPAA